MSDDTSKYDALSIVVTYKSTKYITRCLEALTKQTYTAHKIVVIDNGSRDNIEDIVKYFDEVHLIKNTNNHGYAYAVNQGLRIAMIGNAKYAFVLNPDIDMDNNVLETLIKNAEKDPSIGAVGPEIVQMGSEDSSKKKELSTEDDNLFVHWIMGCGILLVMENIKRVGFFDTRYFLYFEETDFLYRMKKCDLKILKVNTVAINHLGGASAKYIPTKAYFYMIRNIFLFVKKNKMPEGYSAAINHLRWELRNKFYYPIHPLRFIAYIIGILVGTLILIAPLREESNNLVE